MTRQPPAVRFQAEHSNECWHFDLSPSDLKQVEKPSWVEPDRGNPLLMRSLPGEASPGELRALQRC